MNKILERCCGNIEMKKKYIILILAFTNLLGCNFMKKKSNRMVQLNYYEEQYSESTDSLFEFVTNIDTVYLDKIIKNDTIDFTYKLIDNSIAFSFSKSTNNDTAICLYGSNTKLFNKKTYKIENHDFTVLKYYYDELSSVDEEASYFYNKDYGILVGYSNSWMDIIFSMVYDANSKILVDSIIQDLDFLQSYASIPPPPPRQKSEEEVLHD